MRTFGFVFAALVAGATAASGASIFGDGAVGVTFRGGGEWKMPGGQVGEYQQVTEISPVNSDNVIVTETVSVSTGDGESLDRFSYRLNMTDDKFVRIYPATSTEANPKEIGGGYCFDHVCHWTIHTPEVVHEESFHHKDGVLHRIGSRYAEHKYVAWKGRQTRQ